jgi:hypothetical protein
MGTYYQKQMLKILDQRHHMHMLLGLTILMKAPPDGIKAN